MGKFCVHSNDDSIWFSLAIRLIIESTTYLGIEEKKRNYNCIIYNRIILPLVLCPVSWVTDSSFTSLHPFPLLFPFPMCQMKRREIERENEREIERERESCVSVSLFLSIVQSHVGPFITQVYSLQLFLFSFVQFPLTLLNNCFSLTDHSVSFSFQCEYISFCHWIT